MSLAGHLRTDGPVPPRSDRMLFSENSLAPDYQLAAHSRHFKCMWEGSGLKVFDLAHDPIERFGVTAANVVARWEPVRARFEEECARKRAQLDAAEAAAPPQPPRLPDPERERRLKALGYVQ